MVWIKGHCVTDPATMRRAMAWHRSRMNIYRKWSVPPRTTLAGLAQTIKRELVAAVFRDGFDVGFELRDDCVARPDEFAANIAEEQPDQSLRWYLTALPNLDEIEQRVREEREAHDAAMRQEVARRRAARAARLAAMGPEAVEEENRQFVQAMAEARAASAAAPGTRWEQGRYQPEPEPEPEPVTPVWLQEAACAGASAAAA